MESGPHIRLILWKAGKAVETVDRASIDRTGLGLSDFTIMEALLHKGPLPINRIGEKVLLSSGSMTAAVNRLEKKGYVRRRRDPVDARTFQVHLTGKGRELIGEAFRVHSQNLETVVDVLTDTEKGELVRLLKKIGRRAGQMPVA